jgi:DNA-binding NarL/FixJ family response regulator
MTDLDMLLEHLGSPNPEIVLNGTESPIRMAVMIVDSQALFRSGLVRILEEDDRFHVVAASGSSSGVVEVCIATHVDVLVTDLDLGTGSGIELISRVSSACPNTRVLILTSVADSRVLAALAAGAAGFVLKDFDPVAIRSALVAIHLGGTVLCREAVERLMAIARDDRPGEDRQLTKREADVVRLIGSGAPNRDIASTLSISDKTVRNYVSRVYRKLALEDRTQVAMYALRSGLAMSEGTDGIRAVAASESRSVRPELPSFDKSGSRGVR